MHLTTEETLTLALRRRAFEHALADPRVQGALVARSPFEVPRLSVCPCCAYPTLTLSGMHDDCLVCRWEDDGQDDPDADESSEGGPHYGLSLTEARRNFIDHGHAFRADDKRRRLIRCIDRSHTERATLRAAYDALLPDVSPWYFIAAMPDIDARVEAVRRAWRGRSARRALPSRRDEDRRHDALVDTWNALACMSVALWNPYRVREARLTSAASGAVPGTRHSPAQH